MHSTDESTKGVIYGFLAYGLWGLFPLYFGLLKRSDAFEVVSYRIIFALLFCLVAVVFIGQWNQVRKIFANRSALWLLLFAGIVVAINWTVYVWAVNHDLTLDASLGYFINPLVSALLGVIVLREKMRWAQWLAFGISTVAVLTFVYAYGKMPWVALILAVSFGSYGLFKKQAAVNAGPLPGLAVETIAPAPFAIGYMLYLFSTGTASTHGLEPYFWLLTLAGPITAIPLIFFAASAGRIPLSTLGFLQYICPIGQFLIGWLVLGEELPANRLLGFAIIWLALIVFIADAVWQLRRPRQQAD